VGGTAVVALSHCTHAADVWYVAAMMVVLGVYVFGVYTVVSRGVLESLDQQLRRDFQWVAASGSR